jgi:regulator of protease activity HflC (stomatin/prohibitin superfamily)
MFWKLAAAVAAAIVATQIPQLAGYWFWILLLGVIVAFVIEGVRIVPQQSAWVVERLGKFHGTLEPGLNLIIPFLDRIAYVHSLKEVPLDVPEQICITRDNTQLGVDGILYYQVTDPRLASYGSSNYIQAISQLAQTTLRSEIGKMELDKTVRVARRDQPADRRRARRSGAQLGHQGAALRDQEPDPARGDPALDAAADHRRAREARADRQVGGRAAAGDQRRRR